MKVTAGLMAVVMYFTPAVFLADEVVHAAPIVDPRAPIPFQPTMTQGSAGIAVINITAPNPQGLSVNQFQSLSADAAGLVFNNSLIAGTSLIGGQVGANPNLAGRTASTILAQVTSTGTQYASVIAGPLEVFGNPATLIWANPNGISVRGAQLTNMPGLVLTTGVPQFLTGVGGAPTDYAHAGALAYSVTSGHIQVDGAPGTNGSGPGPGIDGTVGNIDLIGQTIGLNAPLRADQRLNMIAGNQLVSPTAADASGTTYGTASNGAANTATAIGNAGVAIDASQFGSVTSGQIFIVATAAGMGVNQLGALGATAGNVVVNVNGDITVGSTYANQDVSLAGTGNTIVTGTGLANQNYTVSAGGDITGDGTVSAGQDALLTAGGNLSATSVAANGNATLTAGNAMTVGSVSGQNLALQTGTSDLTVNSALTAPGTILAQAGRDLTVHGTVAGGSTVTLAGVRDATINGLTAGVGDVTLSAQTGTATTTGAVITNGQLSVAGQQGVNMGGTAASQGNATIVSDAGNVTVAGDLSSPGQIIVHAGQDATVSGQIRSGQDTTVTAARDVALDGGLEVDGSGNATVTAGRDLTGSGTSGGSGTALSVANDTMLTAGRDLAITGTILTGNNLNATAAQDLSAGSIIAVGDAALTATAGNATLVGDALSGGDLAVTAGAGVHALGSIQSLGNLNLNAQGGSLTADGTVQTAGTATLDAAQDLMLNAQTTVSQDATLTGANITTQGIAVGGNLLAHAANRLDTSAGQMNAAFDANAPALSVSGNATLTGADVMTANAVIGGLYSATGTNSLTTGGTAAWLSDATLAGGTLTNVGQQMAAGTLTISGSTVNNEGALSSLQSVNVTAADLVNSGSIYGPTVNLSVTNGTTNTGALLATDGLTLTTAALDNSNGLVFAGDVNNPQAATGDVTVNVNGGNGTFTNTGGAILAQNALTVNLPNQAIDPSAASFGSLNGGSAFNLMAQAIDNMGAWTLPGTAGSVTATLGITNTGTISHGGGPLALNGDVTNAGTITAADLVINGSLANAADATVQANDAFTLNGSGTNAGIVEAANTLTITGASYDNSNGTTRAGDGGAGAGNLAITLSGDLTNAGGTLTATNDLTIQAASVINSAASSATTTATTTVIDNPALIMALVVGTDTLDHAYLSGAENGFCCTIDQTRQTVTLADALSPDGTTGIMDSILTLVPGSPPVTRSGFVTFVEIPTVTGETSNGNPITQNLWYVQTPENASLAMATITVALPTSTETVATTGSAPGASSVIAAGHDLTLMANSLDNQGGTVSAANDANINVQSLSNGGSTYSSTVTDTVDQASIDNFLAQAPSTISIWSAFNGPDAIGPYSQGYYIDPAGIRLNAPGTVTPLSVSSSVTVQGQTGQIIAGNNLNVSGGNLTNAGTLAAGNDVSITASSFTNQGTNTGTMTTTAGCAAGFSAGCASLSTTNPNSESYSYQQINSNVVAGHDLVIAADTASNTYGNLVAGNNVVIGGTGTTASSPTEANSVTNTSGAIEAGNEVNINAATLTNTIAAPVQVHQNYGSATPFIGCTSNCEAYIDVPSAAPATISANHDVNLTVGTFSNTGSLVTALDNVTINATGSASNDNQYLHAYWSSGFTHYGTAYATWGCANDPALCQKLYGSAYSSSAAQDPAGLPSAVGLPDFVPGTIQAGNTVSVNAPTLTNTGNITSQTVNLTGSQLVNGLTNPNVYTPPPAISGQVITLGPPAVPGSATTAINGAGLVTTLDGRPTSVTGAAGLPANSPIGVQTVGKPVTPSVQTIAGQSGAGTYLTNNPAAYVTGSLAPTALLAALPANLQPDSAPFYYDPYTESQLLEQAALQATGKASFHNTTSATDSTSQASIANQDKAMLYGAALQYAEQNNIALGTQLSEAQLALITMPMLWYVEETVPQPGCTVTGNGACPTVQALVPEVLLPQNYASVSADGEISGMNVTLDFANSILNTGSISAQNLTVNTGTLTNEQRSTNIGTIYNEIGTGVAVTTGTLVQQGGFMSAMNYDLNAQTISQIGGALQQINADGSVNQAATADLLANLKSQLGSSFTQDTVSDNLNTTVIADGGMAPIIVFQMVMIVAISVVTAGAASAAVAGMQAAAADAGMATLAAGGTLAEANAVAGVMASSAFAMGGVANAAIAGAVAGLAGSAAGDVMSGTFSVSGLAKSAAIGGLTAGLLDGITLDGSGIGFSMSGSPDSLASLAGVQNVGNTLVPQAGASTAGSLPAQAAALAGSALVQAGVQTAIDGGSFLTTLRNDAVADVAAAGAYAIGQESSIDGSPMPPNSPQYVLAHALLGCAASAAEGTGCASGAVGEASSAFLSYNVVNAIDPTGAPLDQGQIAGVTALAVLAGGGVAGLLGQNATVAATWAENEALNNATSTKNPDYAAKMLGYDRQTFGDMIHSMKDGLNLGGADNVIWHANGDVEFNGKIIGNMHDY